MIMARMERGRCRLANLINLPGRERMEIGVSLHLTGPSESHNTLSRAALRGKSARHPSHICQMSLVKFQTRRGNIGNQRRAKLNHFSESRSDCQTDEVFSMESLKVCSGPFQRTQSCSHWNIEQKRRVAVTWLISNLVQIVVNHRTSESQMALRCPIEIANKNCKGAIASLILNYLKIVMNQSLLDTSTRTAQGICQSDWWELLCVATKCSKSWSSSLKYRHSHALFFLSAESAFILPIFEWFDRCHLKSSRISCNRPP
jgi:hypothetical protein